MKNAPIFAGHFIRFGLQAIMLAALAVALLLAGASTWARGLQPVLESIDKPSFPSVDSASWKDGTFPSIDAVRQVQPGMDKDQIRDLLDRPHFSEGIFEVREWNYIFHFRNAGAGVMTCQFMVRFSDRMLSTGSYWRTPECAALAEPSAARIVVKSVEAPQVNPLPYRLTLNADDFFRPFEAGKPPLRPGGVRIIELLAAEIQRKFRSPVSILVTAHTARTDAALGDRAMSLAQANAVRDVLVQNGMDAAATHAQGVGQSQPLMDCPPTLPARSKDACMRANRRIDIEVIGAQ